jgi:tetratricopeptide (TPR) repeat protein
MNEEPCQPQTPGTISEDRLPSWSAWAVPLIVVVVTFVAFLPSLQNGFVNWDDQFNFTENPRYRGLGWANLRWMFTTFHAGPYQPLSWLTLGLDYVLWGMDARGYHLTSLILHTGTVLAFYFLAVQLIRLAVGKPAVYDSFGLRISAASAALLFGVHPLRVESVAWATERRDVVSGLFFMLTLLAYLKACQFDQKKPGRRRWLALSLLAYVASLLGKGIGITLPLLLVLLDVYPLRRLRWAAHRFSGGEGEFVCPTAEAMRQPFLKWSEPMVRMIWLEKVPFFIFAVVVGLLGVSGQVGTGAVATLDQYGLERRLGVSLFAAGLYLYKTVVPANLSPLYPMPQELDLFSWPYLLSGGVLLAITIAAAKHRHRAPGGLVAWLSYLVLLAPVSGLTQMGPQIAADRYTYLSCLGFALFGGWAVYWLRTEKRDGSVFRGKTLPSPFPILATVPGGLAVLLLASLTWFQTTIWHDSVSLWRHAGRIYPASHLIQQNWGAALGAAGDQEGALAHYREAARLAPQSADAQNNIGLALVALGRAAEAETHLRRAIELKPTHAAAYYNLANAMVQLGRLDEAARNYRLALERRGDLLPARVNLAGVLERQGGIAQAETEWQAVIRQDPATGIAYDRLAMILSRQGRYREALDVLRRGVAHCPGEKSLNLRLAWLLASAPDAKVRNGAEAVRFAERLAKATDWRDPLILDALAAAYAEAGRMQEAVKQAVAALDLAESSGKVKLAQQIRERLQMYKAGRTYQSGN